MIDTKEYYKLLNIHINANSHEIKIAYRKKAKVLHPDKNKNLDTTEDFQKLTEAYETLIDEAKRTAYDNNLSSETKYTIFEKEEITENDFFIYNTNTNTLECGCEEWVKSRKKYPPYDPRRLCKHLVKKFDVLKTNNNGYPKTLNIPKELKPFEDYLIRHREQNMGVKLFQEIVFLKSSIVVIDYNATHITLYLREQPNETCSYRTFEVHKYRGKGYRWVDEYIINKWNEETGMVHKDNIDGKDYINKRFKVNHGDIQLCNYVYAFAKKDKEEAKNKVVRIQNNFKSKYKKSIEKYVPRNETEFYDLLNKYEIRTTIEVEILLLKKLKDITSRKAPERNLQKLIELLKIMDENTTPPIPSSEFTTTKKTKREREWLRNVSCHSCGSKNIHKKDKRQRKEYKVQRYQCMDCKSIFQEIIDEKHIEETYKVDSEIKDNTEVVTIEIDNQNKEKTKPSLVDRIRGFFK